MIYVDNAATTKLSKAAFDAMTPWLLDEYGNASQPYSFARAPKKALSEARTTIANCINAHPDEIFFTSGGTESDNWAVKGTMLAYSDTRAMLTSAVEHHAVIHACRGVERMGYPVAYLPVTATGVLLPDTLVRYLTDSTKLVSVMLANNELGTIQPIAELVDLAHSRGALFHTDAVQAVGHIPVDVTQLGVDMLSASAHKFNGPKGVGFLYVKAGTPLQPFNDGGAQEFGMRGGTENVAGIVGMAQALRDNWEMMDIHSTHLNALSSQLLERLVGAGISFQRNGDDKTLPGLLSLSFPGGSGEALLHRLDLMGICISTGSACDSKNTAISHVLKAIDLEENTAKGTIRISFGRYNTPEDVATIASALVKALKPM